MNGPTRRLRALAVRAPAQIWSGLLGKPTQSDIQRMRAVVAQGLDEDAARLTAAVPESTMFNDPPIFPYDIDPDEDTNPESPYNFASATLHIGDTTVPVTEPTWQNKPRKTSHTIVGTVADDGTVTVVTPAAEETPVRRRGGVPLDCPCTAIYGSCRCPVRR